MFQWLKRLFARKDSPSNKIKIIDGKEYVQTIGHNVYRPRTRHLGEEKHPPKSGSGVPHSPRPHKAEPTSSAQPDRDPDFLTPIVVAEIASSIFDSSSASTPDSSSSSFDGFGGGDSGGGGAGSDF